MMANFDTSVGCMLDPHFLPIEVRESMRVRLSWAGIADDLIPRIVDECSLHAQQCSFDIDRQPAATVQKELEQLADNVYRLRQDVARLAPTTVEVLSAHFDALAFLTDPPVALHPVSVHLGRQPVQGAFLSLAMDLIEDLQKTAEYAAGQVTPDRQGKPNQSLTRRLVRELAGVIQAHTGARPPYSKGTWFPEFVEEIAGHLGLRCGQTLVESALSEKF